jgi:hypothetical protein
MNMNKSLWMKLVFSFVLLTGLVLRGNQYIDKSGEHAIDQSMVGVFLGFCRWRFNV